MNISFNPLLITKGLKITKILSYEDVELTSV